MPQFDITTFPTQLFWLIVTFSTLYFVVARVVLPRFSSILEMRQSRIQNDLQKAEELQKEAAYLEAEHRRMQQDARNKAHAIVAEIRQQIQADIQAQNDSLKQEMDAVLQKTEQELQVYKENAQAELTATASQLAEALFLKITGNTASAADVAAAVAFDHKDRERRYGSR